MKFEDTETFKNLARSFAGECQAGMRYQMIAKLAMKENLKTLADTVRSIAKNETLHATQFFNKMIEKTGSRENVSFDAGYYSTPRGCCKSARSFFIRLHARRTSDTMAL